MKAHIAISILTSLLLTATALPSRAAEESIADHKPATTTGVIALGPTDTHFNFSTLWEKQFTNDDANQDLMSMAVSAGNIFIGLVYYDAIDDRKGNLFIREFNTTTGEETDFTLLLPEKQAGHIYSNPIVFNDESEALYWGWVVQDAANKAPEQLQIFSIDAAQTTYSFVKAHDIGVLTTAFTGLYLESIDNVRGSIADNTEEMRFLFADNANGSIHQYLIFIKNDDFRSVEIPIVEGPRRNTSDHQSITWHPTKDDIFAIHDYCNNSKTYHSPRVFQASYSNSKWSVSQFEGRIETDEMLSFRAENAHDTYIGNAYCLGIHAFEHQGIPMLIIPVVNSNNKSQFQLASWPETEQMTETKHLALLPENPFHIQGTQFNNLRQLIKTEKVTPKAASRADISESETRLYIFSPSAGIAAYSIGSKAVGTGIDNISDETPTFYISDHTLYVGPTADSEAIITDIQGRTVLQTSIHDGYADLSPLGRGLYIIRVGQHTAKIAL